MKMVKLCFDSTFHISFCHAVVQTLDLSQAFCEFKNNTKNRDKYIFFLICLENFNKLPGVSSSYALSSPKMRGCKDMVRITKFNELLILLLKENILPF